MDEQGREVNEAQIPEGRPRNPPPRAGLLVAREMLQDPPMKRLVIGVFAVLLAAGCGSVSGGNGGGTAGTTGAGGAAGGSAGTSGAAGSGGHSGTSGQAGRGGATGSAGTGAGGIGGSGQGGARMCGPDPSCARCTTGACCGTACCAPGEWCDTSGASPTCRCGANGACTGVTTCASGGPAQIGGASGTDSCGFICCGGGTPCPLSRRVFKRDIENLDEAGLQRVYDDLRNLRLTTYAYKADPQQAKRHLGFIIDDTKTPYPINADGNTVDLYGYLSMAVAAIQVQSREIEELRAELAKLRREKQRGSR
jgi:endosialidase-like protein